MIVCLPFVQIRRQATLRQQRVGRDRFAGDRAIVQHRDGHADLVGAFLLVAAGDGQRPYFFWE